MLPIPTSILCLVCVALFACSDPGVPLCGPTSEAGVFLPAEGSECERLSSYQLFEMRNGALEPAPGVVAYDVRTSLFSDYTRKSRYLWMPPHTTAHYAEDGSIELPVGTILVKTFAIARDLRRPNEDLTLLETRLLIRRDGGWRAHTHSWNRRQSEAIADPLGGRRTISWHDSEGERHETSYLIPNTNHCRECHGTVDPESGRTEIVPLGLAARHLNRASPGRGDEENQITHLVTLGLLQGAPAPRDAPRAADAFDPASGSLDDRARAYLDINCGHCHSRIGTGSSSGLLLGHDEVEPRLYGICKRPIRASRRALPVVISPGQPARSDLLSRMESVDASDMMPKVGRTVAHSEARALIAEWIVWLGTPEAKERLAIDNSACVDQPFPVVETRAAIE